MTVAVVLLSILTIICAVGFVLMMRAKNLADLEVARLQVRNAELDRTKEQDQATISSQKNEISSLRAERTEQEKLVVKAESERTMIQQELTRYREDETKRNASTRIEIEALSNRIFDEKTTKFTELGKTTITDIVAPVKTELERLKKSLEESEKNDAVREANLKSALSRVVELNTQLGSQAEGLAKALKGDNKMVGDFGEDLLERILEFSGLRKGEHFVEQGEGLKLKSEDGSHLKPDVLILLPEKRCLVVDSKMSLLAWANAQSLEEPNKAANLDAFRMSVRAHINNLASKSYTESLKQADLVSIDFKFLFIPIEAAFHACLQLDPDLYKFAFDKRIILTSPTTLLATLTTVNHTWRQYDIGRNAQDISDRAGKLLDKLNDFLASMEDVGKHLDKAKEAYGTAYTRLVGGSGNLVGQAEKLKELGVKTKKQLPKTFQIAEDDSIKEQGVIPA